MKADELGRRASELVSGWQRKYVSQEEWSEAYDCLCDMGMYDLPRAETALERLMEQYDKWERLWGNHQISDHLHEHD